ncbi:MAG: DUF2062 domain-containing protein [Candidatus Pristimantibacillus sp.]
MKLQSKLQSKFNLKTKLIRRAKYYCLKILRIKKSDHIIAIGFISGFFHCWFPTFGIGMLLSIALAKLLRGNLPASIIAGSIGSVLWPVLFFLNYKIGYILNSLLSSPSFELDEALAVPVPEPDYSETADHFGSIANMGMNFLVGSLVNSLLFSLLGYYLVRYALKRYRQPLLKKLRPIKQRSL